MNKKRDSAPEEQNGEELVNSSTDTEGAENKKEKKKREKKKRVRKEYPKLRKAAILFCAVFLAGMLTVSSVGLYVVKYMSEYINGDVAINLDEYKANQSQTTILYTLDKNGNEVEVARLHGEENRIWVNLDGIPKDLQEAFIALEDTRFRVHQGVDWRRTIAVLIVPKYDGQGGSTITQQLIKNLTGERDVTYVRKYREILNALNLEKHYSKETILEAYLNTLYLDAGCYGVQTAAEYYFGKDVDELNLAECACIAAITQEPRANNPILNYEKNRDRMEYTLDCMLRDGYINQEEYDEAIEYDLVFTSDDDYVETDKKEPTDEMITITEKDDKEKEVQGYYVDYVIESVIKDLMAAYNYSYNEAWRKVYYGGLKIHVAVDLEIQKTLEDIYYNRKGFPTSKNSHGEDVQSCMVIMDYEGRVLGIIGQAGEKDGARCLNIATDSKRQPGSSIKPLSVYSYAIDSNIYNWSSLVQNFGILVNGQRWPKNYGGDPGDVDSFVTIQQALPPSLNTVPAQILKKVSVSKSYNWLKDTFKITSLEEADSDYAPLATGAMSHGVYALEMCAAYATFGNSGKYYEPYCYYTVTNNSGSTVYLTHNDAGEQVMEAGTADVMNKLLQTVTTASNGTARAYRVSGFDMFAKTGTTTDEKDRWFIGGTPYYVCSVWMGYSEYAEELDFSKNYCGQLYQTVMNKIHSNLPTKSFEYSKEIVKRTYCLDTGLIAGSKCVTTATGWYKRTSVPSTCTTCPQTPAGEENVPPAPGTTTVPTTSAPTTAAPVTSAPVTAAPAAGG